MIFFIESCPVLDSRLRGFLTQVADSARREVPSCQEAIVLGGGYGRGEGGVYRDDSGGSALYNDLDFFVFCRRRRISPILREWIAAQSQAGESLLGIHVDFTCATPANLSTAGQSMMFADLALGHLVVSGPEDYVSRRAGKVDLEKLPLSEATRLLWNRGSGLFFARQRIARREERDFVERNHAKCMLALGDAVLCLHGAYHPSCLERAERLEALGAERAGSRILELHRLGVEFKLRPRHSHRPWTELEAENRDLAALWLEVFLRVESVRLGCSFETLSDYIGYSGRLMPERPLWKNPLLAARDLLKRGGALKPVWDYPRAALMRSLAILNGGEKPGDLKPFLPRLAASGDVESAYTGWWTHYQ